MLADLTGVRDGELVEEVVTGLCDSVDLAVDLARHHHTLLPSGHGQHHPPGRRGGAQGAQHEGRRQGHGTAH